MFESILQFPSLVGLLRQRAADAPGERAYTFLLDGEAREAHLSYGELERQALAVAVLLQAAGARQERVLLLFPPGLDYVTAFVGCLAAGAVAVPAYPPDPARLGRTLPRLEAVIADAQARFVLTTQSIREMAGFLGSQAAQLGALTWLAVEDAAAADVAAWRDPGATRDTLAFLQYTSGSTGTPRGVMLSHGNLLHNSAAIHRLFGHGPESRGVIWLPPYHDMGLIGGVLQPLCGGFPVVLMSPLDFLARPLRWLQAISRHRATTSGGPNFAYDLCVRKTTPAERAALDLTSWTLAFNGAEPIHPETLRRFSEAFAPAGFRPTSFYPCYGLAEATLIATGGEKSALPRLTTLDATALRQHRVQAAAAGEPQAQTLVGCGTSLEDQALVIVDPDTGCAQAPGVIGEIWVSGPSVAQGYWNRPEETARSFPSATLGNQAARRFLRTGDLGLLDGSELLVTGRIKDLIIIRGHNHYPQDIERTVELLDPALRPGCSAAFSVPIDDEERLIVVGEVDRRAEGLDLDDLILRIRQTIADQHEIEAYGVVLVRAGSIAKTSSGKIQRHACRSEYLADSLTVLARSVRQSAPPGTIVQPAQPRPATPAPSFLRDALAAVPDPATRRQLLVLHLQEQAAAVLRRPPGELDPERSLYAFGLDSLGAVELRNALEASLGLELPLDDFLHGPALVPLADGLLPRLTAAPIERTQPSAISSATEGPVSAGQAALWFLHQLQPGSAAYHVPIALRVRAGLDVAALRRSFEQLAARHPVLRTTFTSTAEGVRQRVHNDVAAALDFAVLPTETARDMDDAALRRYLQQEAERSFDLEQGPLLRIRVASCAANEHVLLVVMHHIITDFWSLAVLAAELDVLYPAACRSPALAAALPPLGTTCLEAARAEAAMLAGPQGATLAAYWDAALADEVPPGQRGEQEISPLRSELPALALPTDYPRPAVLGERGSLHSSRLPAALTEPLKALARARGTTLSTLLQTAFQALLHRYSGQRDFLVGIVGAGRSTSALAPLCGYLVNPLLIRTRPAPDQPFTTLLDQTHRSVLGALGHQGYPFSLLVDRLQPVRDTSRTPLIQALFVFQRAVRVHPSALDRDLTNLALDLDGARAELAGLPLESIALEHRSAQFELTLTLGEIDGQLVASWEYNTELFRGETIARMARHYTQLLASIVAAPAARLDALPLIDDHEHADLLAWSSGPALGLPVSPATIPALVAAQIQKTPAHEALRQDDAALDYRTLGTRVATLAGLLVARGIGPGDVVGIFLERSLDTVVAVLGVLWTGAAYLPLDPAYPDERLVFLLGNARADLVLTHAALGDRLARYAAAHARPLEILALEEDLGAVTSHAAAMPEPRAVDPAALACLIYTSGSTGQPKGVMLDHGGLVNLVTSFIHSYHADAHDRMLPLTALASASFVGEILPLLCVGGTVVLPSESEILDPEQLLGLIADRAITIASTVPAVVAGLNARRGSLAPLRLLLSGGEALGPGDVDHLLGQVEIANGYGLTETTVCATYYTVHPGDLDKHTWVPIGRPIVNTTVYVLDDALNLLPVGCPGQIYVGGRALARGYWHEPGRTADRFLPDPFQPEQRMYRTGDRGRWLPGGVLEYLQRVDDQVKIRGFRIEVGEIEAVLKRHPRLSGVFVTAREDTPGDRRLVAYVVAQEPAPSLSELHSYVAERLPHYMVPSAFVALAELPLGPHGKVELRRLPAPDGLRPALAAAYAAPQSELERRIAAVWQAVLKLDQVGIHDNFFELGGNSLLIAQVHRRLQSELDARISLIDMFKYSTVSLLAHHLGQPPASDERSDSRQQIQREAQQRKEALQRRQQAGRLRGTRK